MEVWEKDLYRWYKPVNIIIKVLWLESKTINRNNIKIQDIIIVHRYIYKTRKKREKKERKERIKK